MSSFTKYINSFKNDQKTNFDLVVKKPATAVDDSAIVNQASAAPQPQQRRWSYVTYLNEGTYHGDGDNLMLGL
ncbi:CIC11C00000005184 [Sungouiella intermedia]|uniref:CIC11C00000005184 n=1 Tax=Sungouiella intermedia TaxID=45354 RepID=A0A1L0BL40_9ASCO|nr:CIC11C00000005184 [[Candida] intermedia]